MKVTWPHENLHRPTQPEAELYNVNPIPYTHALTRLIDESHWRTCWGGDGRQELAPDLKRKVEARRKESAEWDKLYGKTTGLFHLSHKAYLSSVWPVLNLFFFYYQLMCGCMCVDDSGRAVPKSCATWRCQESLDAASSSLSTLPPTKLIFDPNQDYPSH